MNYQVLEVKKRLSSEGEMGRKVEAQTEVAVVHTWLTPTFWEQEEPGLLSVLFQSILIRPWNIPIRKVKRKTNLKCIPSYQQWNSFSFDFTVLLRSTQSNLAVLLKLNIFIFHFFGHLLRLMKCKMAGRCLLTFSFFYYSSHFQDFFLLVLFH